MRMFLRLARRSSSSAAQTGTTGTTDPWTYCSDLVMKKDYESFLLSKFYPKHLQGGYFALKAFSIEMATIPDSVSNPMIGAMRMQFWRDAVKAMNDGRPPQHPIALALHELSRGAKLSTYHLKRIIDAREAELQSPTYPTIDSLIQHAESTSSSLVYLLLSLLDLTSQEMDHAASHLGVAQTITTLIRALPFHLQMHRMVVPAEITADCGLVQEDAFRHGQDAKGLDEAVFRFATLANDHLFTSRTRYEKADRTLQTRALPVFLAGVPVSRFLERLEQVNFDVFSPSLRRRDWKVPWSIWLGHFRGSF